MTQPNLLQVQTGKEQGKGATAQLMAFVCPTPRNTLTDEVFLSVAAKNKQSGVQYVGKTTKIPAAPGKIDDYGFWYDCSVAVEDHTLIKLVGSRSLGVHGQRPQRGAVYIRTRAEAALNKILFRTTGLEIMAKDMVYVQGRFDILDEEMVDTDYPGLLTMYTRRDIQPRYRNSAFTFEEIAPEIRPLPQTTVREIVNAAGEQVNVRVRKRKRAIKL